MVEYILIIFLIMFFAVAGGQMARMNGRSFLLGALIGLFLNIPGLLIIHFIGRSSVDKERTFNPNFSDREGSKVAEIKHLARMHQKGQLSDEEFEQLKNELIQPQVDSDQV